MELNAFKRLLEIGGNQLTYEEQQELLQTIELIDKMVKEIKSYVNLSAVEILALNEKIKQDQETIRYLKDRVGLLERTLQANR